MRIVFSALARVLLTPDVSKIDAELKLLRSVYRPDEKRRLPKALLEALIAGEDHRFYHHNGVDYRALLRCARNYLLKGRIEGGSTIDQQFVRTLTRRYERTALRKCREILLASYLQGAARKAETAELYLHVAYFGWRMNGVLQACRRLGYDLEHLSQEQSALIVAALKYPMPKNVMPAKLARPQGRQAYILRRMAQGNGHGR